MANEDDDTSRGEFDPPENVWYRGLWMLILVFLFALAELVLFAATLLQFAWLLFAKEKNELLAEFGTRLGNWLLKTARYQTAASDDKPFPWSDWD